MIVRRLTGAAALAVTAMAVPMSPAGSVVPTCDGLEATIVGTSAGETLTGTEGPDVVWLGAGNDRFKGLGGDDVICGGDGFDWIYPGAGNDRAFGEADGDLIYDGPGDDYMDGGSGSNRISYFYSKATGLRLDARIGQATSSTGTDTFTTPATYYGTAGPDTLIGSSYGETINAGAGDTVYGLGGSDFIYGEGAGAVVDAGDGPDEVTWSGGPTRINLGDGNDMLTGRHPAAHASWSGGPGTDSVGVGSVSGLELNLNQGFIRLRSNLSVRWSALGFETVYGSYGSDRIVGNAADNYLRGYYGNDVILGLGGDDSIWGDAGNDWADGGTGSNTCAGIETQKHCASYTGP